MTTDFGEGIDCRDTDIAVIGMAGRFPGAADVAQFWRNLREGVESIATFTPAELRAAGVAESDIADPDYVPRGPVLAGIDLFDAEFFGLTPREAELTDPQHRLFVEVAWQALEDAGHDPASGAATTGVFAGSAISTYLLNNLIGNPAVAGSAGPIQLALGNDKDSLATRVAYALDLQGPAVAVQSYCSTSLVAVATACTSLISGDCDIALAGGAAISVPQQAGYRYQPGGISSPDGHCRAFDAKAAGAPIGNAVAAVVLRRLEDAIAEGDHVYAVIRGWAVNNDGALKAGYTAPGVRGQARVIAEAMANADVDPADIDYVEAHGTGTALGDAAEFAALKQAFAGATGRCAIGSLKTNVGHLDRAAGVSGLIKVALSLQDRTLAPTLHFTEPNPQLALPESRFTVQTALAPWPDPGHPRLGGVSSFGIGGTNAHVVLTEAPVRAVAPPTAARPAPEIVVLSARCSGALERRRRDLADHLDADHLDTGRDALADVAHTLQVGRRAFEHRCAVVAHDPAEVARALRGAPGAPAVLTAPPTPAPSQPWVLRVPEPLPPQVAAALLADPPVAAALAGTELATRAASADPATDPAATSRLAVAALGALLTAASGGRMGDSGTDLPVLDATTSPQDVPAAVRRAVAALWVGGVDVDWAALRPDPARRVPLPGYPFSRRSYWIEPASAGAPAAPRDWLNRPVWQAAPLHRAEPVAGPVLVLADGTGIGDLLAGQLAGDTPVAVAHRGDAYRELPADRFAVRAGHDEDYARMLATLTERGLAPATVAHLWAVDDRRPDGTSLPVVTADQEGGFDSVRRLGRAVAAHPGPTRLLLVSSDAVAVDGTEALRPGKATLAALGTVLGQERLELEVRSVDLAGLDGATAAAAVVAELGWTGGPAAVALRAGGRYTRAYVPLGPIADTPGLRDGGVYLITGGLGDVGLAVAASIAERPGTRIVLAGRHGLPQRDRWRGLASGELAGAGDTQRRRIQRVLAIADRAAQHGGEVVVEQVDVARPGALAGLVERTRARFGRIAGVVHAAGRTARDGFVGIGDLDAQLVGEHFAPKVDGSVRLAAALAGDEPDFCVLLSSMSAVLGGLGFGAYAAANAFLDGYAVAHNRATGSHWQVIDFDTWEHVAAQLGSGGAGASMAANSMSTADGVALLHAVIGSGEEHVTVSVGDLDERLGAWTAGRQEPARAATRHPRPSIAELFVAPGTAPERALAEIFCEVLGLDRVGIEDNFFELGGNSLVGLQLMRRVQIDFAVQAGIVALFDAPTVRSLVESLGLRPGPGPGPAPAPAAGPAAPAVGTDIAVIGMAGRFPGADGVEQFWRNLDDGVESITRFTDGELRAAGVPEELIRRTDYVRHRPVLADPGGFDPAFFGLDELAARLTDPQQRLFLECAWQAMEHAGYAPGRSAGPVGVFGGANFGTYLHQLLRDPELAAHVDEQVIATGNDKDALATTVSYRLDLRGPSMSVQTFCSTSLVAVHLACRSLRDGECAMALAGGVSVRVPDRVGHLGEGPPDGHVRPFDAEGHGLLKGDGAAIVLLKPLAAALADGDPVLGVIKGSAVTNDGAGKGGYAAPSVAGQAAAAVNALAAAGVDAATVSYVEAHASATPIGDAIELAALTAAYGTPTRAQPCRLGSVKGNVGHLEHASGVTGLIKALLSMEHARLPATLHLRHPAATLDLAASPFELHAAARPWPRTPGAPRRAGVNSLGLGGTNAHVVVEEAPELIPRPTSRDRFVLPVSARTPDALREACAALAAALRRRPAAVLADVAYTLQVGRTAFEHRAAVVCTDVAGAVAALDRGPAEPTRSRPGQPVALDVDAAATAADAELLRAVVPAATPAATPPPDAPVLRIGVDGITTADDAIAALWVLGVAVDWAAYHDGEPRRRVALPTYPFQRRQCWLHPAPVPVTT